MVSLCFMNALKSLKPVSYCSLRTGDIFLMKNPDDSRRFGESTLCMATDCYEFVVLTGDRCGELVDPGFELSDGSNTDVLRMSVPSIVMTGTPPIN